MKNIHLIPTDKPSRLGYLTKKGKEVFKDLRLFHILTPNILDSENQHLYITGEEEIKEGDWVIFDELEIVKCTYSKNGEFLFSKPLISSSNHHFSYFKKIILTTDQDLIEDGVQAITNTFAEWFVENPTCEYVETKLVEFEVDMGLGDSCVERGSYYKINTPKEEPKINLEEMSKEEWDEARNPAYKHFDIDAEYPELDGTNALCNDKVWDDIYHDYSEEQYPAFGGPFTDSISFIDWLKQNYKSPEKK